MAPVFHLIYDLDLQINPCSESRNLTVKLNFQGIIPMNARDLDEALEMGMDWSLREGYVWPEDKEHCEEYGRMLNANPSCVSTRAKKRGLPQLGTLGAGNHYAEIQVCFIQVI